MGFRAWPLAVLALTVALPARAQAPDARACAESRDLATKLQESQKLLEARDELIVCSAKSCSAAIRNECKRRMTPIKAAIPTVVFDVKDEAGQPLAGVKLTMETGDVLADSVDARAVSIDPGSHDLTFELAGRPPVTLKLTLREGEKDRHEAVVVPLAAPPPPVEAPPPAPPPPVAAPSSGEGTSTQRAIGIQVGSVGAVGLTIGAFFGVAAIAESFAAKNNACPSGTACSQQGTNDRSAASGFATASAVGLIAGAVVGGTGLVLVLTAPNGGASTSTSTGLVIGPGHVGLAGRF
jgi:hypothetical protein